MTSGSYAGRSGDAAGSRRLVLATHNEHKVHELVQILGGLVDELGLEVVSASAYPEVPETPETEVTFEGNARLKAVALAAATGLPSVADDSGLAVDVLGGSPGVFSARWSGTIAGVDLPSAERDGNNVRLLLDQVEDVADEHRAARFVCAAVLAMPDGRTATAMGEVRGVLVREASGSNGFGYDPIFRPDGDTRTLAEYTDEEKNAISHRGNAFRTMIPILRAHLA